MAIILLFLELLFYWNLFYEYYLVILSLPGSLRFEELAVDNITIPKLKYWFSDNAKVTLLELTLDILVS